MPRLHNPPASGKNCRTAPAAFADVRAPLYRSESIPRMRRRTPLFAQFPPAALFMAISRAVSRCSPAQRAASGTGLAISRFSPAAERP